MQSIFQDSNEKIKQIPPKSTTQIEPFKSYYGSEYYLTDNPVLTDEYERLGKEEKIMIPQKRKLKIGEFD